METGRQQAATSSKNDKAWLAANIRRSSTHSSISKHLARQWILPSSSISDLMESDTTRILDKQHLHRILFLSPLRVWHRQLVMAALRRKHRDRPLDFYHGRDTLHGGRSLLEHSSASFLSLQLWYSSCKSTAQCWMTGTWLGRSNRRRFSLSS
jgi:hypothetical protein